MKRNIFFVLLMLIMAASICVSCKSTPKVDETASAKADEARKRAMDFQAPAYFPSEWEVIEAQYEAADNAAAYGVVALAYDELFKKAVPLYAQAREDEIMAAREQLIHTGFTEVFPQYLEDADNIALSAMEQYEAEDYYKAKDTAAKALSEYETLLAGAKIYTTRQEIIDRGFVQYDADNFVKADEIAQATIDAYDAGDKQTALANGEEAMLRYNLVLANGWTAYAANRKASAAKERELALAERANIASRETFREAEALYVHAEELFASEVFNNAALGYVDSEAKFAISRKETEERRLRAEQAIRMAEEKIEESNEAASEATRVIEGVSR